MVGGQRLNALDCVHDELRHGGIVVIPNRMVILADGFRQLRVRDSWAVEFPLEDDKNWIPTTGDVLLRIRLVRHLHKPLPQMMGA